MEILHLQYVANVEVLCQVLKCIELSCQIFLICTRFTCSENREAYKKLTEGYDANIVGMVMEGILLIHKDKKITYTLSNEADKLYEKILHKLNNQFNLKYTSASQLSASQSDLNNNKKSELSVCTKGTEIIGRLTCALWIYCNGNYNNGLLCNLIIIRSLWYLQFMHI